MAQNDLVIIFALFVYFLLGNMTGYYIKGKQKHYKFVFCCPFWHGFSLSKISKECALGRAYEWILYLGYFEIRKLARRG